MPKFVLVLTLLALSALFSGCYRHNIVISDTAYPEAAVDDTFHHSLFWGLANIEGDIDARNVCPNGVARVHTKIAWYQGIIASLTGGIYTPSQVRVYCAQ
ncbi:MAG: hypothetical protein ACJAYU_002829 [Bradymonadia bacterium]|jgi:hypothetical protein